jgi:uncharacterized linocin/CFP29 family protein
MLEQKELDFLNWIINRLVFKHNYSYEDFVVRNLHKIIVKYSNNFNVNINKKDLDLILSKYYADFFLDNCEDLNIGYSENDRENLRIQAIDMVKDIVNNNIPKEPLIKG